MFQGVPGAVLERLGAFWCALGRLGRVLGALLGRFESVSGAFLVLFWAVWEDISKRFGLSVASWVVPGRLTWFWSVLHGLDAFLISERL